MSGAEQGRSSFRYQRLLARLALVVLSVAPFAGVHYFLHFTTPGATGFTQYDMPYYVANGREVFERGNGVTYPSPYDTNPEAPAIYFHWLLWLLGFGVTQLGIDPGLLLVALGVAGAVGYAWLTLRIVELLAADRRNAKLLFLLAMWGAGVVCLGQAAVNVLNGRDTWLMLQRLDPTYWFTNWGRNSVYPTESAYHVLAAASWLAALRGRWNLSLGWAALLAATHPFSGLQQLLIQCGWSGSRLLRLRSAEALRYCGAAVACLAVFGGYYGVFLPSTPQHQAIQGTWSMDWSMGTKSILVVWGPVAVLAAVRLWRDRNRLGNSEYFLVVCWAVSFLLVTHDRLMAPMQPLHFTRGYVWFPLFLLALPLVEQGLAALRRAGRGAFVCGAVLAMSVGAADNIVFVVQTIREPPEGFVLSEPERAVFRWAEANKMDGVLLCESETLCYLSATYTRWRPFVGHMYLTPGFEERVRQAEEWFEGKGSGVWFDEIDWILAGRSAAMPLLQREQWEVAFGNEELVLLRRGQGSER